MVWNDIYHHLHFVDWFQLSLSVYLRRWHESCEQSFLMKCRPENSTGIGHSGWICWYGRNTGIGMSHTTPMSILWHQCGTLVEQQTTPLPDLVKYLAPIKWVPGICLRSLLDHFLSRNGTSAPTTAVRSTCKIHITSYMAAAKTKYAIDA